MRTRNERSDRLTGQTRAGLVVSTHGRHAVVEDIDDGTRRICHPRGKKLEAIVGDRVAWLPSGDEGTIERIDERRNSLYRQDELRTKAFAANIDQALILLAASPKFSDAQLGRALVACEAAGIRALIALNKADLHEAFEQAWGRLTPYRNAGYATLKLAVKPRAATADDGFAALQSQLHGKATLVLGPSGVGKSSLANRLIPGLMLATNEISQALNSGKHTTTGTTWYWLDASDGTKGAGIDRARGALIDSPGFQEFGLNHIKPEDLAAYMPDIAAYTGRCKFYNCTHLHEPGCGVRAALEENQTTGRRVLDPLRYSFYSELYHELSHQRSSH